MYKIMDKDKGTEVTEVKSESQNKKTTNKATETIKIGWKIFKERPWVSISILLITQILTMIVFMPFSMADGRVLMFGNAFNQILSAFMGMIVLILFFDIYDKKDLNIKKALMSWRKFINYVVANILVTLATIGGLILLIIPGVIIMFRLIFVTQLVVDRDLGPIEAIKKSWRMTKGNMGYISGVIILSLGVIILGMLALMIGLVVAIPVVMYAMIHAYRTVLKTNE